MMIAFHTKGNLILQQAFKTKSDLHCIAAYNTIMTQMAAHGLLVNLQILDNKARSAYKEAITIKWNAKFQLFPTCTVATKRSVPFADSRTTSCCSWRALMPPFLHTFGAFCSHRLNLHLISSSRPCSMEVF
jgi:hypothetical protein